MTRTAIRSSRDASVNVELTLGANLLPAEAQTDSLTVMHMEENASGEIADAVPVATAADDTLAVTDSAVEASFTTDSFSTFTITWQEYRTVYFQLNATYVDGSGTEISAPSITNASIRNYETVTLDSTYGKAIEGYTYQYAEYNGQIITSLKGSVDWVYKDDDWVYVRTISFYNGDTLVATLDNDGDTTVTGSLTLVYSQNPTASTTPGSPTRTLSKTKTATLQSDGSYNLDLTISGAYGSQTDPYKADVLLIVDRSGSMEGSRLTDVKSAANNLVDTLSRLAAAGTADVRYSVVTFSSSSTQTDDHKYYATLYGDSTNDASWVNQNWTGSASEAKTAINAITADGGTNYQAGINQGVSQMTSARSNAEKIVIFLTDGLPTYRVSYVAESGAQYGRFWYANYGYGDGNHDANGYNIAAAVTAAAGLQVNEFYCIGVGSDFTAGSTAANNLTSLSNAVTATTKAVYNNSTTLANAFSSIAASITQVLCDHVSMKDTLSSNVAMVMNGTAPKLLTVTVKNADGTTVGTGASVTLAATAKNAAATLTPAYSNGVITLTFPTAYKLETGWTYTVTANVRTTQAALDAYAASGTYSDTADAATGTYAGLTGLFSNNNTGNNSSVTYTYGGTSHTEDFPKPVVRVTNTSVSVSKVWVNSTGTANPASVQAQLYADGTASGSAVTLNASNNWSYTWNNLNKYKSDGTTEIAYTVQEVAVPDNYSSSVTHSGSTWTITNTYTPPDTTYGTVTKTFSANVWAQVQQWITDHSTAFSVVVKNGSTTVATLYPDQATADDTNHTLTWTVSGLAAGTTYTVSESGADLDGYSLTSTGFGDKTIAASNMTITFNADNRQTSCNKLNYNVGTGVNIIVAKLTGGETYQYFVWTEKNLSANERQAVVSFINAKSGAAFSPSATLSNVAFYSGNTVTGANGFLFRDGRITYNKTSGVLSFDASKQWAMFVAGTYSFTGNTETPEIAVGNDYTELLGTLTITKNVSSLASTANGTTKNPNGGDAIFQYRIEKYDTDPTTDTTAQPSRIWYVSLRLNSTSAAATTTLTGLPKGYYKVTELDTFRYTLASVTADNGNTCSTLSSGNYVNIYKIGFGYTKADGTVVRAADAVTAKVLFTNNFSQSAHRTDTDAVENSFTIAITNGNIENITTNTGANGNTKLDNGATKSVTVSR